MMETMDIFEHQKKFKKTIEHPGTHFAGDGYEAKYDKKRLTGQGLRIFNFMISGEWKTLAEVSAATNAPEGSASSMLRKFREKKMGSYILEKRRKGDKYRGLWEYRLLMPAKGDSHGI